jgi:hypothetical protein
MTDAATLALQRVRTNDAVHTYADPSGGYEMFYVFPLPKSEAIGRSVRHDNAPFMLRVITRRAIRPVKHNVRSSCASTELAPGCL